MAGAPAAPLLTCETGNVGAGIYTQSQAGTYSLSGFSWYIGSSAIFLDSGQRRMMIRRYVHDLQSQTGNVTLTINADDYPGQLAASGSGQGYVTTLTVAATDLKKDFRRSGRVVSVRFAGDDASGVTATFARQGRPVFDLVPMGGR